MAAGNARGRGMSTLFRHGPRLTTWRERAAMFLLGDTPCVANVVIGPHFDSVRAISGRSILAWRIDFDPVPAVGVHQADWADVDHDVFGDPVFPPRSSRGHAHDCRRRRAGRAAAWIEAGAVAIGFVLAVALIAAACLSALSRRAAAHEWYPYSCCSDKDCRPVPPGAVRATPAGWLVVATGETIAFDKARFSPDGQFHVCSYGGLPDGKTICLFAPGMGS